MCALKVMQSVHSMDVIRETGSRPLIHADAYVKSVSLRTMVAERQGNTSTCAVFMHSYQHIILFLLLR